MGAFTPAARGTCKKRVSAGPRMKLTNNYRLAKDGLSKSAGKLESSSGNPLSFDTSPTSAGLWVLTPATLGTKAEIPTPGHSRHDPGQSSAGPPFQVNLGTLVEGVCGCVLGGPQRCCFWFSLKTTKEEHLQKETPSYSDPNPM